MARSVQIQVPVQHAGFVRTAVGAEAVGTASANIILGVLAVIGKPVTAAASGIRRGLAAWSVARKQRVDDEKLWNLALQDARIMADLSRAMSQDALRDTRGYY
jgi:hypothetical protein